MSTATLDVAHRVLPRGSPLAEALEMRGDRAQRRARRLRRHRRDHPQHPLVVSPVPGTPPGREQLLIDHPFGDEARHRALQAVRGPAAGIGAAAADSNARTLLAALGWLATMGWGCLQDVARVGPEALRLTTSFPCLAFIVGLGLPMTLGVLWLARHAALVRPAPVAALGGLSAAALASVGLSVVHHLDAAVMAGLLPILWSTGTGSELMQRIAVPMVCGMVSSTVLTLLVIPAIYGLVNGWRLPRTGAVAQDAKAFAVAE